MGDHEAAKSTHTRSDEHHGICLKYLKLQSSHTRGFRRGWGCLCKKKNCKKAEGKLLTSTKFMTLKRESLSLLKVLSKWTVMSTTVHPVFQWYSIIGGFFFSGHVLALLYRNMKHFLVCTDVVGILGTFLD